MTNSPVQFCKISYLIFSSRLTVIISTDHHGTIGTSLSQPVCSYSFINEELLIPVLQHSMCVYKRSVPFSLTDGIKGEPIGKKEKEIPTF